MTAIAVIKCAILAYAVLLAFTRLEIIPVFFPLVECARAPGTFAEYDFDRQQCIRQNVFSDSSTLSIAGHLKSPKLQLQSSKHEECIGGNGFRPRGPQSLLYSSLNDNSDVLVSSVPSLKVALGAKPFAIEFWMRVSETHNVKRGLLFIDPASGRVCPSQFQVRSKFIISIIFC